MSNKQTLLAEPYEHWIGMAGYPGCTPNACDVYDSRASAINGVLGLHDLGDDAELAQRLELYEYVELPEDAGNVYASVTHCTCLEPWVHEEGTTAEQWLQEHDDLETEDQRNTKINRLVEVQLAGDLNDPDMRAWLEGILRDGFEGYANMSAEDLSAEYEGVVDPDIYVEGEEDHGE